MAGVPWWKLSVYAILQSFLMFGTTRGDIECVCSTPQCRQLRLATCTASAFCYTQFHEITVPAITRGCIDDHTPLLCENRRPEGVQGPWPVLHCCRERFCNKDVTPSVAPWRLANNTDIKEHIDTEIEIANELEKEPEENDEKLVEYTDESTTTVDIWEEPMEPREMTPTDNSQNFLAFNINPILIAVPLAGACALVAIGAFAVYILRKRQYSTYERNLQARHIVKAPPDAMKGSKYSVAGMSDRCSECSQSKLLSHV